jgi:hypothetical protein
MLLLFVSILALSGGMVAYATSTIFTQNFPGQSIATADLTTTRTSLTLETTSLPVAGSPALLEYDCGSSAPAFTGNSAVGSSLSVIPIFNAPAGSGHGIVTSWDCASVTS